MTKKDYVRIAASLHKTRSHYQQTDTFDAACVRGLDFASLQMADVLSSDNPRFDRARFLSAVRGEN